jgi:hypothetical protein
VVDDSGDDARRGVDGGEDVGEERTARGQGQGRGVVGEGERWEMIQIILFIGFEQEREGYQVIQRF